ncbi:MAG: nucleotide exchange factor GrpE [Firmicutes bacterium]|nr:nucleotide exchange factor GrpE [Bacillota bacterium]MBQ3611232.1 nucleotide exchange factor GrpE [Bacillota bacterium]MBQ4596565.1 nucleotide exchange factor GrpE [Bacillota bacterium]MBR1993066.1 nucleotide exchange factor GrpE [Bacillota bacterium]MBR3787138.1 nucleotide exchange factor GrpE [Bacillota bacterium]
MTKVNGEDVIKEDIKDTEAEQTVEENAAEDQKVDEKAEAAEEKKEEKEAEPEEDGDAKYLRLMADFQNYKKRVEKEKKDLYSYANEKLVTELLAVLDNFERALAHEDSGDGFKEGMEMIFKQLMDVLEKSGLAEIAALGEDFDPNFHNAVMTEETEEYESGKVSGVLQKGYTLNGKVIRPSMVKVVS